MKFSVLLPTRNRLEFLRYAVETVRRQEYDDWEIIISDNHSDQDIGGYAHSLHDERVRFFRTDRFLPVTDNWNNALEKSVGDYVIMLGDDDCLLPGYLTTIKSLVDRFDRPDVVYTSALLYAYPGVLPGHPEGLLQPNGYANFLRGADEPFLLDHDRALSLVRTSMSFRVVFGFNMQFVVVSRAMIDRLRPYGSFYQSPYPDYYAMNALFLKGERILVYPKPLVIIGISPKSFGYYYFNEAEESGVAFLQNVPDQDLAERLTDVILPGSNMNTSWLLSMEALKVNFEREMPLRVHYRRYRLLQLVQMLGSGCVKGDTAWQTIKRIWTHTRGWEKPLYGSIAAVIALATARLSTRRKKHLLSRAIAALGTYPRYEVNKCEGIYGNILEAYEAFEKTHGLGIQ
jgi:glycosyltransferase involved in cell wall biosynthesis